MSHNPGSIGNAVRELAPGATFRVHNDGLVISDLEWLDEVIQRPSDEQIEELASKLDEEPAPVEEAQTSTDAG